MDIKIKKLNEDAIIPQYQTRGAGAFDIHSNESGYCYEGGPNVFSTGLSFEIPENFVMLLFSRSGHGFKDNVRLSNCVGVIDSDYRGELKVKLSKDSHGVFHVKKGDRIAQGMIVYAPQVAFQLVDALNETERGVGGFGSTG